MTIEELQAENRHLKAVIKKLESKAAENRPKLTDREVKDIRWAYRQGMPQYALADNYGVNPSTISRLVRGLYH